MWRAEGHGRWRLRRDADRTGAKVVEWRCPDPARGASRSSAHAGIPARAAGGTAVPAVGRFGCGEGVVMLTRETHGLGTADESDRRVVAAAGDPGRTDG